MGDPAHLERMGKELKCPICWSLFNSAVSLTCNHVFCNSCIVKSMKSGSACPVCKVPFTRREVRPAPHMDNLVSIYKSMEVSSGMSIFVTQNVPVTKSSDYTKQCEVDVDCDKKDAGGCHQNDARGRKHCKKNESRKKTMTNKKSPAPDITQPTFPGKKRVQVPQNILSETPLKNSRFGSSLSEATKEATEKDSGKANNERHPQSENDEHVLSPFFWLREEEDGEKLSQQTNGDQPFDGPTPVPPSFSDLRDSDDENPSKVAPSDEVQKASVDLFDSEMFEWTQRPCSPELFSSPVKIKVANNEATDEDQEDLETVSLVQETNSSSADADNTVFQTPEEVNRLAEVLPPILTSHVKSSDDLNGIKKPSRRGRKASANSSHVKSPDDLNGIKKPSRRDRKASTKGSHVKSFDDLNGIKKPSRRGRKASAKAKKEQTGEERFPIDEMNVDSNRSLEVTQEQTSDKKHKSSDLGKTNGGGKGVCFNTCTNPTPQLICTISNTLAVMSSGEVNMANNSYTSPCKQQIEQHASQEIVDKSQRKRSEKQRLDNALGVANELSSMENQTNELAGSASPIMNLQTDSNGKASNSRQRKEKLSRKSMSCSKELTNTKKLKLSSECFSKTKSGKQEIQSNESSQQGPDVKALNDASKEKHIPLMDGPVLQRCESHLKKYQCAFCLSSEESEASGPIVHYCNGKPVAADYGGSNALHSHRNCTEWAPNVYFEDDTAINLEAEINRSRRIKCGFCGLKGAALGCYERSCRRSFHVPCAKLTSQCRWDMENFVMLCPLHASSKLPCESSGPQVRSNKCTARDDKGLTHKHDSRSPGWIANGANKKIVLCCSAISAQEMDVVSEFERVSKVRVSKKWDSSVTHVIASTDENGACKRTLKVLLGILEGKWVVNIEWIKACVKEMKPVDEERYEINVDTHGIKDGPRLGRLRVLNKQPKLFNGYQFYLMGDFIPSYKGYLQDLITAAGGIILHRKPVSGDQKAKSPDMHPHQTLIIYSLELPNNCNPLKKDAILSQRRSDAEDLAGSTGSKVASNAWILNSIAACELKSLAQ